MPSTILTRFLVARASSGGGAGAPASTRAQLVVRRPRHKATAAVFAGGRRRRATCPPSSSRRALVQLVTASSAASVDALLDAMIEEDGGHEQDETMFPAWLLEGADDGEALEEAEADGEAGATTTVAATANHDEATFGAGAGPERRWDHKAADTAGRATLDREKLRRELASFALDNLSEEEEEVEEAPQHPAPAAPSSSSKGSAVSDASAYVKLMVGGLLFGNSSSSSPKATPQPSVDKAAALPTTVIDTSAGRDFFGDALLASGGQALSGASEQERRAARERNQFAGDKDKGLIPESVFAETYSTRISEETRARWLQEAARVEAEILAAGGGR
jgi:hypothetical protein